MNAVMTIKHNCQEAEEDRYLEAFFGLFHTPEIKARRADRMQRDAEQARRTAIREERVRAEAREEARKEYERRERVMNKIHQREVADMGASVAGGLAMAAGLLGLAMLV